MAKAYDVLLDRTESLIDFFKHRQSIEVSYANSLKKLHTKQSDVEKKWSDSTMPEESQLSWRIATSDIIEALSKECQAHQALAQRIGLIHKALSDFKDNRERMRRRIRDDLRNISTDHQEFKQTVVRLRKNYERKVEEVQQNEDVEDAPHYQHPSSSLSRESFPPEHWTNSEAALPAAAANPQPQSPGLTRHRTGSNASKSDTLSPQTSPPHNHVIISGATASHTSNHNRDLAQPGASNPGGKGNVFDAFSKRDWSGDKQRVNSIVKAVGNLAKGPPPANSNLKHSNSKHRSRSYTTKLRREAEQADRDYRDGVFRLETLRLQKERIHRSAMGSLRELAFDMSASLRESFDKFVTDLSYLSQSRLLIAEKAMPSVAAIDAVHDADSFLHLVKINQVHEPQVYYVNAFVGECKNLLFGVSLTDYHSTHPNQLVPLIVERCIEHIDSCGLNFEGIYRISGKLATVQQLVHQIEKDEEHFRFTSKDDPALVAGVLKLYLRQLPSPLCPFPLVDRLSLSHAFDSDVAGHHFEFNLQALSRRIRRLPRPHQATLKALCEHLDRVAQHSATNKMTPTNLGLLFTPVVFGEDDGTTLEAALQHNSDIIMEVLITHHALVFEGLPVDLPVSQSRSRQGSMRVTPHDQQPAAVFPPQAQAQMTPATAAAAAAAAAAASSNSPYGIHPRALHDQLAGLQLDQAASLTPPRRSSAELLRNVPERSASYNPPVAPSPQRPAKDDSLQALADHYQQQQQQAAGGLPAPGEPYELPPPPINELLSSTPPLSAAGGRVVPKGQPPPGVDWEMDV